MIGGVIATPNLSGHTALVIGAGNPVAASIAMALALSGANVAVTSATPDAEEAFELRRLSKRIAETGRRTMAESLDLSIATSVQVAVRQVAKELGAIDLAIVAADLRLEQKPADRISDADWAKVIALNLSGVFYACREAVPEMKRRGGGFIINIGSLAGRYAMPGGSAYNASKFGLIGFSEAMMLDVRQDDIRVSCVMPGSVATHFNNHTPTEADAWKIQPEDIAGVVLDLLATPARTLPSRVEVRPSKPAKK